MEFLQDWLINLLVAMVTAVSIYLFTKFIHPFILGLLQKTPDLSGTWQGFDIAADGHEIQNSRMTIRQLGTSVYATVHRQGTTGNNERVFKYTGTISSGQVLLIWKETKSNGYNMGTMTLLLSGDLKTLTGKTTYHYHDIGKIVSNDKVYRFIDK